jgi:hypothetical protein
MPWNGPPGSQSMGWDTTRTHGMTGTPTWRSWEKMIQRCTDPKSNKYPSYGGRGIKVCARWLESFENFLADMGERPEGKTLGRIGNSKNYYPLNCEWQTPKQQANNTRTNRYLCYDGTIDTITGWGKRLGIASQTISYRLEQGWPRERIFAKGKSDTKTVKNTSGFPGVYRSRSKWRAELRINGKMESLGRKETPLDAYLLRVRAAAERGIKLPEGDRFLSGDNRRKPVGSVPGAVLLTKTGSGEP